MTIPGQAPTEVSRPKTFGEGSRVRSIRENVARILKEYRDGTLLVHVQVPRVIIKSVNG